MPTVCKLATVGGPAVCPGLAHFSNESRMSQNSISFRQARKVGHPVYTRFAFTDPVRNHGFSYERKLKLRGGAMLLASSTASN